MVTPPVPSSPQKPSWALSRRLPCSDGLPTQSSTHRLASPPLGFLVHPQPSCSPHAVRGKHVSRYVKGLYTSRT